MAPSSSRPEQSTHPFSDDFVQFISVSSRLHAVFKHRVLIANFRIDHMNGSRHCWDESRNGHRARGDGMDVRVDDFVTRAPLVILYA